jgi:hypothetical protein
MAELLISNGWDIADSVGKYLREHLTDEYLVVCEPIIQGHPLDAIVVAPDGLAVLYVRNWQGEVLPSTHRPWRERTATGEVVSHDNPGLEARKVAGLLQSFVRDEFPGLDLPIRQYLVLTEPTVALAMEGPTEPPCVRLDDLVKVLHDDGGALDDAARPLADATLREEVALALRDRQITASQRTLQPFIFRSGGALGTGYKAYTIRDVVRQMDRRPEDGVHHLRNGTLERWLTEQGAPHLAALARDVTRRGENNPRVMLEEFLLGTGLVPPPRISIHPRTLNMGYVVAGETVQRRLRVRRGRGRGYLYGTVWSTEPWIRVEPGSFSGELNAVVSVDSEPLLIREQATHAEILIKTNAAKEPVAVPIVANVVSMPAGMVRRLFRPLAALAMAGVPGALPGLALGIWGVPAPAWLTGAGGAIMPSGVAWALIIGLFWAILGGVRGAVQPPAWPILYAGRRWLLRTAGWAVVLALFAGALTRIAMGWYPEAADRLTPEWQASITLFAVALSVLPGTVGEMWAARPLRARDGRAPVSEALRRAVSAILVVTAVFVLLIGVRLVGPAWVRYDFDGRVATVRQWVGQRWDDLDEQVNTLVDRIYLRWYDRSGQRGGLLPWDE